MSHTYKVREIAQQAGLSEATVDRVLNARGGVRASTVQEVNRAIADLDRQQSQLRIGGRTFLVDVVMSAPSRFTRQVREALEAEQPLLRPAVIRSRFHLSEQASAPDLLRTLNGIRRRGSQGVILKGHDDPDIMAAVAGLEADGIPVVTFVTDLPGSRRAAYVGIDNRAAGATAAYLIAQWLGDAVGDVLVAKTSDAFQGEEEREAGFRSALLTLAPRRVIYEVTDTGGLDAPMRRSVRAALTQHERITAVYSIGGGNPATVETFAELERPLRAFVAHDLDEDNVRLLRDGAISVVLHHDLRQDMRRACQVIMQAHRVMPGTIKTVPSAVQIITPYNRP